LHCCAAIALDPKIDGDHDVRHNAPLGTLLSTRLTAAITHPCNFAIPPMAIQEILATASTAHVPGRTRIIV